MVFWYIYNRQIFLNLLDKHFPQNQRLHKIFNRSSVKVSFGCTKSMKTIITNHNTNILGKKPSINKSNCNCRNKKACPLNGQCQIGELVYESTLSSKQPNYKEKEYFGIAEEFETNSIKSLVFHYLFTYIYVLVTRYLNFCPDIWSGRKTSWLER